MKFSQYETLICYGIAFFSFVNFVLQKLSDTTPDVREAAMQALGTALRIVGEKPMNPLIADLEKLKLDKVTLSCSHSFLSDCESKE